MNNRLTRLSKLQKLIIIKLGDVIVNSLDDGPHDLAYRRLFEECADYWFKGVPPIEGEPRHKAAKQAFSRAAWSLMDRGILDGIAIAWCEISTTQWIGWQGGGPTSYRDGYAGNPRPQIKKLFLTPFGIVAYKQLGKAAPQDGSQRTREADDES
jgi:hypothetical protein